MAKTRLRKYDRDLIGAAIIDHKFQPLRAAQEAEGHKLATEVYESHYDLATRKVMEKLPKGAFQGRTGFGVTVNGQRHKLELAEPRPFFASFTSWDTPIRLMDSDDLGARIVAQAHAEDNLRTQRDEATRKVHGTLAQFATFEDLLIAWPEAEAFINARLQKRTDYVAPVPAVQIKDLSAALDLPPELAEAA